MDVEPQEPLVLTSCFPSEKAQVPKDGWHPSLQYAAVVPQNPFSEQQFPKLEVKQVAFVDDLEPQLASKLVGFRGNREEREL